MQRSARPSLVRRVAQRPSGRLAVAGVAVVGAAALFAPWIAPYDPVAQLGIIELRSAPPSFAHPFGTDPYSRDVLSRVLHGARVSLAVGVIATLVATTVGTAYGAIAGFAGGRADAWMMRLIDAMMAVPRVLLVLAVTALWGRVPLPAFILLIGLTSWFPLSRLARAEVQSAATRDYAAAARALGARRRRVLIRHLLPNVIAPLAIAAALGVAEVIALEAGLSYLGLGVQPPHASWGSIMQDGADQVASAWWITVFPGAAVVLTALACNALADALRDALDPRQLPEP